MTVHHERRHIAVMSCVFMSVNYAEFPTWLSKKLQLLLSSPLQRTGLSDGNVKRQKHKKYSIQLTDMYICLRRDFF